MRKHLYKLLLKTMMGTSYKIPMLRGRVGHAVYPYMFTPEQLMEIAKQAKDSAAANPSGSFVEAGCAYGATTVFLKKLLPQTRYYSIDTFSGFTVESLQHEVTERGKPLDHLKHDFVVNKKEWYQQTLDMHGAGNVNVIQSDVTLVDFKSIGPIAFCLLDVDLYLPIADCLPKIYEQLLPGGVIVIDDCQENNVYDGAEQAYREFCSKMNLPYTVKTGKLGIVKKPAA